MCFFVSLFPATFWLVIAYFVLFSSHKVEGGIKKFGQILGVWIIVIAALILVAGAYVAISGLCPIETMLESGR